MTPTRLVDPVHFFNHRGESVMTMDALHKRVAELEKELAIAQNNCRVLAGRLKRIAEARGS